MEWCGLLKIMVQEKRASQNVKIVIMQTLLTTCQKDLKERQKWTAAALQPGVEGKAWERPNPLTAWTASRSWRQRLVGDS